MKATAVLLGAQFNKVDIINLFVDEVDLNVRDKEGRTVLLNALWGTEEIGITILQSLLKNGADVNAVDNTGQGPLHYCACFNRSIQTTRLLLKAGASINGTDTSSSSPLWYAVKNANNYKLVEFLLEKGATFRSRRRPTKKGIEKKRIDALLDKKEKERGKSLTEKDGRTDSIPWQDTIPRQNSMSTVDSRGPSKTAATRTRSSNAGAGASLFPTPAYAPLQAVG